MSPGLACRPSEFQLMFLHDRKSLLEIDLAAEACGQFDQARGIRLVAHRGQLSEQSLEPAG